nr:hypothetical protein CDS [Bradyrhizobium sp.]
MPVADFGRRCPVWSEADFGPTAGIRLLWALADDAAEKARGEGTTPKPELAL